MKQENVEGNTYIGKISEIENKNWRRNKFEHPKIAKKRPQNRPKFAQERRENGCECVV